MNQGIIESEPRGSFMDQVSWSTKSYCSVYGLFKCKNSQDLYILLSNKTVNHMRYLHLWKNTNTMLKYKPLVKDLSLGMLVGACALLVRRNTFVEALVKNVTHMNKSRITSMILSILNYRKLRTMIHSQLLSMNSGNRWFKNG
ncbi:MAG: hypothetical protein HMLIMOIP_001793 [Candidatus Nitrosomirales archaeon]|jgi:hypothetical protein